MYREIEIQLIRKQMSKPELANAMGINKLTLYSKLRGDSPFTLEECFLIQELIGDDLTLDQLFKRS